MMKKNLSLIALFYIYLFFTQITLGMLTTSKKLIHTLPRTAEKSIVTRSRIPTKPQPPMVKPQATTEPLITPKTIPLSQHIFPEGHKSYDFTPQQQADFEELEKKKPHVAQVIPKTEKEKMFFNNILKAYKQGKALGFVSNKATEEIKQLGPEYKELFENETNIIKDPNGHPLFKSQKIDSGYQFALPTTHQKATLYSIFGTKEKRTTNFLSEDFPDADVQTKNLSTSLTITDIKELFEPIVANTTAKKAELKKQQQPELLNKAKELAENKARLEKIIEALKTKELEEKEKLLFAQATEKQAQQELAQATHIAETKTKELDAAEQTEERLEEKTIKLIEAEEQSLEKEQELTQKQTELEAQVENAKQAEINAQEQLKKAQEAEQKLIEQLKEAKQAEERARKEELKIQELLKQKELDELDALAKEITDELEQQELTAFTEKQQRIIEKEQTIEKNIQDLDKKIELLEKNYQQALQEEKLAKTAQEQAVAQQKERNILAEQEQSEKDRAELEAFKQESKQKLAELKQQEREVSQKQELIKKTEIEQKLKDIEQNIAEKKYDIEQRQAQHLAELEVQHEQELQKAYEASQQELHLSEQQKQERATQQQAEREAQQKKYLREEAELKKEQQELNNLLQQQKDILQAKINSQLKSQQELEQQLQKTKDELSILITRKTITESEKTLLQNQLNNKVQTIQQNINTIDNELKKTEDEFYTAIQESEKIKTDIIAAKKIEDENNKIKESIKMESKKKGQIGDEGDDEKKEQTIETTTPQKLTQAPKQPVNLLLPTIQPITTTEIPQTSTQNIIYLPPSTPSAHKSTQTPPAVSGTKKDLLPSITPTQQTPHSFPQDYKEQRLTGQATGLPYRTTKPGKAHTRNKNQKTQPYMSPRYGNIGLTPHTAESSSPSYTGPSYSTYPESTTYEQPATEASPTQRSQNQAKKTEPAKQVTPQKVEEEQETEEETTPIYKKRLFPKKEAIKKEPTQPELNWLWRLFFWIKKQLINLTDMIKSLFKG